MAMGREADATVHLCYIPVFSLLELILVLCVYFFYRSLKFRYKVQALNEEPSDRIRTRGGPIKLATRIPIPSQRSQKLSWTRQPVLPFLRDMALNCELYTTSSSTPTLFLVSCYHFLYESKQKKIMPSFYSIHHRPTLFFSLSLSICHPFSSFLPFASSAFIYTCCIPSHSFSSKSYAFFFSMESVELRVEMVAIHEKRLRKCLSKIRGIEKVEVEASIQKVVVTGYAHKSKILKALRRVGLRAEFWSAQNEILHAYASGSFRINNFSFF
ncbi:uncharacterized protein LOC120266999 isoform X1 [Dioscorea cayenensis subsp. rotundata]|uniref:Uncharacterized protein LOC120266999 isoform X1 n=2 Tax=Dioscorea TaxID=4672 RepID=A0AB40BT54_DIOCR|nr:uncharacterized protein LOC120266999 isoform X1 [Dioscorea cayenensis subsp. rotundata]